MKQRAIKDRILKLIGFIEYDKPTPDRIISILKELLDDMNWRDDEVLTFTKYQEAKANGEIIN